MPITPIQHHNKHLSSWGNSLNRPISWTKLMLKSVSKTAPSTIVIILLIAGTWGDCFDLGKRPNKIDPVLVFNPAHTFHWLTNICAFILIVAPEHVTTLISIINMHPTTFHNPLLITRQRLYPSIIYKCDYESHLIMYYSHSHLHKSTSFKY